MNAEVKGGGNPEYALERAVLDIVEPVTGVDFPKPSWTAMRP